MILFFLLPFIYQLDNFENNELLNHLGITKILFNYDWFMDPEEGKCKGIDGKEKIANEIQEFLVSFNEFQEASRDFTNQN